MPSADLIVVLADGCRVVEQGPFSKLRAAGGYIQSLRIEEYSSNDAIKADDGPVSVPTTPPVNTQVVDAINNDRQTADFSIYEYYFKALGWPRIALLIVFLVINSGFGSFRCPYSLRLIFTV